MKDLKLVYCTLFDGVTPDMRTDNKVLLLTDGDSFAVTSEDNSKNYPTELWLGTTEEAVREYNEMYRDEVSKLDNL